MNAKQFFLVLFLLLSLGGKSQKVNIIPYPASVEVNHSPCSFRKLRRFIPDEKGLSADAASLLKEKMKEMGLEVSLSKKKGKGSISFLYTDKYQHVPEGYTLEVRKKSVTIEASHREGFIYGVQSLLQEMRSGSVLCGVIEDAPRFGWRGFLLDESRHFLGEKKVKQLLDIMGYYKINRLHWHLTDAPGWRIEIKAFPKLTEVGAIGNHTNPHAPASFYTQEQIRDIVAYAAMRGIEIVPEIDMPGHASAANRAYPEYKAVGTKSNPDFCFNPGKEETYAYLTQILKEVVALFPSKYLHIGGDEVHFSSSAWVNDEWVVRLMEREGLKDVREVEIFFVKRMMEVVHSLGKVAMAWDDIYEEGIPSEGNAITWWRHDKKDKVNKMLASGFPVVLCPRLPLYLDFVQDDRDQCGRRWPGNKFCTLEDVYSFPDSKLEEWNVSKEKLKDILGMQGNAWGELIHEGKRLDYMLFPRMIAMAESAWSNENQKDYEFFQQRMEDCYKFLDEQDIYYYDARHPEAHPEAEGPSKEKIEEGF